MAREVCAILIHSYSRFGVPTAVTGVLCATAKCAVVCAVVCGAVCAVVCSAVCAVVCVVQCVRWCVVCLERPAVLKGKDTPILKQTAILP